MADIVSNLAKVYTISPNKSPRTAKIDTITIHHAAAVGCSAKTGADWFAFYSKGSSNYYIGYDGSISCPVPENYRAWTSNSSTNDNRAITIECANSTADPTWEISKDTWNSLINLLEDVCKRNGIKKLLWKADKSLIGQVDKQNMTIHNWFAPTGCPGPYIEPRLGQIAEEVNVRLNPATPSDQNEGNKKNKTTIANEVIAGLWGVWPDRQRRLEAAGYDYNEIQKEVENIMKKGNSNKTEETYRIRKAWNNATSQVGAYNNLDLAKKKADEYPGYSVFDSKGKKVYTSLEGFKEYTVRVDITNLNIRKGPGMQYARVGFTGKGIFTIVEESNGYGKLKSGAGWIALSYTKKV